MPVARIGTAGIFARIVARRLAACRREDRSLPAVPREESIGVVLELAREAQLAQLGQLTRLDATASALIGFAGIVLGLLLTGNPATSHWSWPLSLSTALLAGSVLPLGYALIPRYYVFSPNIAALDELAATASAGHAQAAAIKSIRHSIGANASLVERKTTSLRTGLVMITAAVAVAGAVSIYDRERLQRVLPRPHPLSLEAPGAAASAPRRGLGGRIAVERTGDTRGVAMVVHRHRRGPRGACGALARHPKTRSETRRALRENRLAVRQSVISAVVTTRSAWSGVRPRRPNPGASRSSRRPSRSTSAASAPAASASAPLTCRSSLEASRRQASRRGARRSRGTCAGAARPVARASRRRSGTRAGSGSNEVQASPFVIQTTVGADVETITGHFKLVGPGGVSFVERVVVHVTVRPDGEVAVSFDRIVFECL